MINPLRGFELLMAGYYSLRIRLLERRIRRIPNGWWVSPLVDRRTRLDGKRQRWERYMGMSPWHERWKA